MDSLRGNPARVMIEKQRESDIINEGVPINLIPFFFYYTFSPTNDEKKEKKEEKELCGKHFPLFDHFFFSNNNIYIYI